MSKLIKTTLGAALLAAGLLTNPAQAQPPTRPELEASLRDLTTLDPDVEKYLPRWKIQEADLKVKLALYFRSIGVPVSEGDSMIVTASFADPATSAQDLLTIRVGNLNAAVISGTQKIRGDLGEALYQRILSRDYAHEIIEPARPITETDKERIPSVLYPTNAEQFVAVSAFRQAVQLGATGARLEHTIGNDEIGYHFWTSGQGRAALFYPIIPLVDPAKKAMGVPDILTITLGVAYRLKVGGPQDNFLDGVISPRRLNGAIGPKAYTRVEYRLPQVNDLGFALNAEIPFAKIAASESVTANSTIAWFADTLREKGQAPQPIRSAYFLRTVAQGVLFWENWLNEYEHFFRVSLGASYQEVQKTAVTLTGFNSRGNRLPASSPFDGDAVQNLGLDHPNSFEDWIFAKVEYLNQSGYPFGLSAQLANRNLLVSGFIPVLKNWLFLEAKYSTPILRETPEPWESPSFFMISPILRFQLDNDN